MRFARARGKRVVPCFCCNLLLAQRLATTNGLGWRGCNFLDDFSAWRLDFFAIALTIYQVPYLMNLKPDAIPVNLGIRLFAWVVTGVLVAMLMYGKQDNRGGTVR